MLTTNGKWAVVFGLLILILGLLFGLGALVVLALLLLVGVFGSLLYLLRRPPLTARQFLSPALVSVGEPSRAEVTVTNTGSRRNSAIVVTNSLDGATFFVDIEPLGAGESATASMPLPTDRRGVFEVGPLSIERRDPLGFTQTVTHQGASPILVVHPTVHPMPPLPTGHRRELEGTTSQLPQEGGISFHSLRDYELGDDLRLIHWRSVAKTGTLMVRKNIITSEPRLMIFLDTRQASYQHGADDVFEDAVRVAASMIASGVDSRYPVMFRTSSGLAADISTSGDGRAQAMRILAEVHPGEDPGLPAILQYASMGDGVSLGVVTGRPEPAATLGVTRVRSRFDMITAVQVGDTGPIPPIAIRGALELHGDTSEAVAALFSARFRG